MEERQKVFGPLRVLLGGYFPAKLAHQMDVIHETPPQEGLVSYTAYV